jgi:hypothetical protein
MANPRTLSNAGGLHGKSGFPVRNGIRRRHNAYVGWPQRDGLRGGWHVCIRCAGLDNFDRRVRNYWVCVGCNPHAVEFSWEEWVTGGKALKCHNACGNVDTENRCIACSSFLNSLFGTQVGSRLSPKPEIGPHTRYSPLPRVGRLASANRKEKGF